MGIAASSQLRASQSSRRQLRLAVAGQRLLELQEAAERVPPGPCMDTLELAHAQVARGGKQFTKADLVALAVTLDPKYLRKTAHVAAGMSEEDLRVFIRSRIYTLQATAEASLK